MDITDPEFGKDLLLQCPSLQDKYFHGGTYYTPGKFVVKAIREFFMACAQLVEEESTQRKIAPQALRTEENKSETGRLAQKAGAMGRIGATTVVDNEHHIMIVCPLTGDTWRLGERRDE